MSPQSQRSEDIGRLEQRYREAPESRVFAPLADAYRRAGHLEEAIQVLRRGVAQYPNYVSALVLLALCYRDASREEEAEQIFARVFELDPGNLLAMKFRAERSLKRGVAEQAQTILERVLEIDPYDREARQRLEGLLRPATPSAPRGVPVESTPLPPVERPVAKPIQEAPAAPVAGESTPEVQSKASIEPPEIHLDRIVSDARPSQPESLEVAHDQQPTAPTRTPVTPERPVQSEATVSSDDASAVSGQDDHIFLPPGPPRGPIRSVEEKVWGRPPESGPGSEPPAPALDSGDILEKLDKPGAPDSPATRKPDGAEKDDFATLTVAKIYESQGYLQQALAIYEELHRKHPAHDEIAERLRSLRDRLVGVDESATVKLDVPTEDVPETPAPKPSQWRLLDSAALQSEASQTAERVREVTRRVQEVRMGEPPERHTVIGTPGNTGPLEGVQEDRMEDTEELADDLLGEETVGPPEGQSDIDFERFLRYVRSLKR